MKVTPTENVGCEEHDNNSELYRELKTKNKKDKSEFKENEVIKEKDFKKKGLKVTPEKSPGYTDDKRNPQPFYLWLSPLIINLIRTQQNDRMIGAFEATVDLTSAYADEFVDKMNERYTNMTKIMSPISRFNTDNNTNITVPKTEVFDDTNYKKERFKVMVTSSINEWMFKYRDVFNIELSDSFSAFVLESVIRFDNISKDTRRNCEAHLDIFYKHIDKKIDDMTEIPEPVKNIIISYLQMLAAHHVGQKTLNFSDYDYQIIIRSTKSGRGYGTRGKSPFKSKSGKNQYSNLGNKS